jgi:hypothetical protein
MKQRQIRNSAPANSERPEVRADPTKVQAAEDVAMNAGFSEVARRRGGSHVASRRQL